MSSEQRCCQAHRDRAVFENEELVQTPEGPAFIGITVNEAGVQEEARGEDHQSSPEVPGKLQGRTEEAGGKIPGRGRRV